MSSTEVQPQAEYAEYTGAIRWVILFAVMLGTLMQVIDSSIVAVAIPQMMGNLGATLDQIGWVTTGYIIANVIVLPLTGWLASTFGRKRYLTASIIIFTVASFFCGTSGSLNALIFFRVLQGAGGAALLSTAQATMMEIFPPQQLGMVQAIYGVGVMVGPTVGPTLGGWITDNYSWPWAFFINIPIGILAAVLVWFFVHDSKYKRVSGGVDFVGIGLLAMGLGAFQMLLEKGNREGWLESPLIQWLIVASVLGIALFVLWELYTEHPAVNLRVLKNKGFTAGTVFAMLVGFALYGGTFILPVFLQEVRGYTAQQTGWILFPGAIATALLMPLVGRLVSRTAARNLVFLGAVGVVIALYLLGTMTLDTGPGQLFWPLVLRGASMGFLFVPLTLATLVGLRGKDMADGTGLFNLARQIGGSAGIAFLSTFLDHRVAMHRAVLVENITPYNAEAISRLRLFSGYLESRGWALPTAKLGALKIVDMTVQGQASIIGFEDVFLASAVIFALAIPLLLLFRKGAPATAGKGPGVHME